MRNEKNLQELEKIDLSFVNHNLNVIGNVPAYALFFLMIPFLAFLSFNPLYIIVSIIVTVFLMKIAIYFNKKNISFLNFFSMLGYIFKPKFIIIRNKEYYKKRLKQ